MKTLWIILALLALSIPAFAADVTVQWTEPTKNTDGSTLADLAFTNGYCQVGTAAAQKSANVPATKPAGGGTVSTVFTIPTPAGAATTVTCWATATDAASPANVSANSASASKTFNLVGPAAPSNITIQ